MTQPKHWAEYRRTLDDPTSTPEQCEAARQAAWSAEEQRGTGRTSRMLEALPVENTPTVVVHTHDCRLIGAFDIAKVSRPT